MGPGAPTSRERVRLALAHQATDRVPIAMVCSGINRPAREALDAYLQQERGLSVDAYLSPLLDIKSIQPAYVGPALPPGTDIWGVHRSPVSYGPDAYHEIDHYPLGSATTLADLDEHVWPSPEWFAPESLIGLVERLQTGGEWCLMLPNANPFETTWYMRGFEQCLLDLALQPELIEAILERVTRFFLEHITRCLRAAPGAIDLVFTADDIGSQIGPLIAPQTWEKHLKPYHQRLCERIHELGAKVIYHSDGAIMEFVPGLIDAGIDILQALQFDAAGMDPAVLKERYGDRLCFQGGVSVQQTLPHGTPEDVRAEVRRLIDTLGRGGGYILGPSHAIQAGTPPANIVAMFDEAVAASGVQ